MTENVAAAAFWRVNIVRTFPSGAFSARGSGPTYQYNQHPSYRR
jgi:hypothetical protein